MREMLVKSLEHCDNVVERFGTLMSPQFALEYAPEALLGRTAKHLGLQRTERRGLYGAFYAEPWDEPTAGQVVNAFTRFAGSKLVTDEQRRYELESAIGEVADSWMASGKRIVLWFRLSISILS